MNLDCQSGTALKENLLNLRTVVKVFSLSDSNRGFLDHRDAPVSRNGEPA